MPSISTSVILALSVLVSGFAVTAQKSDKTLRAMTFGEVLDLEGKPWAKAKVTLVSQPNILLDGRGSADVVEAVTDERGRFRASVLRHRAYSAWAMTRMLDGSYRVTSIAEQVTTGARSKLAEVKRRARAVAIEILNLDEWADRMPLRVQVVSQAKNMRCVAVEFEAGGTVVLPPMPGESCVLEMFGKDGGILFSSRVTIPRTSDSKRVRLGKRREYFVEVRRGEDGVGIADATIHWVIRGHFHVIGKTDRDGIAKIVLPKLPVSLFAMAKNRSISALRRGRLRPTKASGWKVLRDGVRISAHTSLTKGRQFRGRIRFGDVPANDLILVQRGQSVSVSQNVNYLTQFVRILATDDEGRFLVDGGSATTVRGTSVSAALTSADILKLPEAWHRQVSSVVNSVVDLDGGGDGASRDLGSIDVTAFCPVMVEATGPTGLPAPAVSVTIGSRELMLDQLLVDSGDHVTDRAGRLCLLVRPTDDGVIAMRQGSSVVVKRLHVRSGIRDHSIAFLRVTMPQPWTISGTVKTQKGKPVSGMPINSYSWAQSMGTAGVSEKPRIRGTGNGVAVGDPDLATLTNCISTLGSHHDVVKTDKKGEFTLVVPAVPMTWQLFGTKRFLFLSQRIRTTVEVKDGSVKDLAITAK